jgi:PAS domain S-box-containing protein
MRPGQPDDKIDGMRSPRVGAIALGGLGALVLLGWMIDAPVLTHVQRSWPGMAPPTALAFVLLGITLWLRTMSSRAAWRAMQALATPPLIFAITWLMAHAAGAAASLGSFARGFTVAPVTALSLALLAGALLTSRRPSAAVPQALSVAAAVIGGVGVMRFFYDSPMSIYAPMALHTALGVMVAATAILATRSDASLLRMLRAPGPGGVMARALLPVAMGSPLISGWVLLNIQLDVRTHVHVLAPLNALVFGGLVWWVAHRLRASDVLHRADVSARHRAEQARAEQHERFLLLTRATLDTVWDWNVSQDGIWLSDNLESAFGWKVPSGVGRQWMRDRLHPDDQLRMAGELAALDARGDQLWSTEFRFRHADGGYRDVLARAMLLRDGEGELRRVLGTMMDISDRISMEHQLRDRTAELERSNSELERFAQIASHDLQEPLRTISSFVQLIAKRYGDKLDDNGARYIHYVVDGAERMRGLINALLAYSRVDRLDAAINAEVSLAEVVARVRADLRTAIAESHAELTCDELPVVQGNEIQLTQVLLNVISNAVKYRGSEAPRIHIAATREEPGWKISVQDNGIGIDPQYFERIFIVFQRLHTREAYEGTGVGLAICKRIVERHGGRIWVESEPGTGSTFHFTLKPSEGEAHVEPLA